MEGRWVFRERPGCRVTPDSLLVIWHQRTLGGLARELVVNIKCDIPPFAYGEKRKETEGMIIRGENGHHLFPMETISSSVAFNFSSLNCSWNLQHKTAPKSFENLHEVHGKRWFLTPSERFDCCLNGLDGEWGYLHANSRAGQFSYHVCKWTRLLDLCWPNANSKQYADFMLTFHFIYSYGN